MTPKLPDLLIADLLVDPSRNVLTRERAGDSVAFSNVLDAAKGAAVKEDTLIQADQRQMDQRQSDQFAASVKADTRARARAQSEDALTAQRAADADFAAQQSLQRRDEARVQAQAQADARSEARLEARDDSRAAARSAEREASSGDTALGARDDLSVGQADERDDRADAELQSERSTNSNSAKSSDGSVAANPGDRADSERASAAAADSANVAGAMASAVASASAVVQGLASGGASNDGVSGASAVGAIGSASGVGGASALAAQAGGGGGSAWGALSSAQAGASAEGVDQMARQLGLLRSIQTAGAAADSAKIAEQAASAKQQAGAGVDAAAEAIAGASAAAAATATAVDQAATSAAANASAGSTATGAGAGQALAGAQLDSGATAKATASTGSTAAAGSDPEAISVLGVGSGSSLVGSLGASAVANAGLIAAEFVPGALSADLGTLSAAQLAASAKGATGSQQSGSVAAEPDVVQGFAQIARAFDQADAIAQARIARVAAQNRSLSAANGGVLVAGASSSAGVAVSPSSIVLNTSASVSLAQGIRAGQVAQSSGASAIASGMVGGVLGALTASSDEQNVDGEISLGGALGALDRGVSASVAAGPGTSGMGSGSSGNDAGAGFSGRSSAPTEAGPRTQIAGSAGSGSAGSAQSTTGSTFGSALSAAGGFASSSSASGLDAGASSVGAAASSGVVAASGALAGAGPVAGDAALSGLPGAGVSSAVTPQAIGGSLRVEAGGPTTVQSPVTADQLPVALDQTAIDLARLRGGMLTLELAPADLGRLSFEMRIDDSGAAFVAIRLADDTVRALVENAAGALRDSLSREGFKLDSFTVSSGFGSPEQRENSQNQTFAETSNRRVQSSGSPGGSSESVQSRASNTQVRPGTSSLSLFA